MISIFIDESGNFEKNQDEMLLVGGIIVKHQTKQQLKRIKDRVHSEFIELYGDKYYDRIHGDNRDMILGNRFIEIINSKQFSDIFPFFIERGILNKTINSNITDDNMASMRYFNMLNTVVSNLLLYHPTLLKGEKNIKIYLASRVAVNSYQYRFSEKQLESFNKMSIASYRGRNGDQVYTLNNDISLLMHLNAELTSFPFLNEAKQSSDRLDISIEKQQILYKPSNYEYMDLFYVADIICNYTAAKIIRKNKVDLKQYYAFAYDDINEIYRKIYRDYLDKDLFHFLIHKIDYEKQYQQSKFKKYYDQYLNLLQVDDITNSNTLKQTLQYLEPMIKKTKQYSRKQQIEILDFIENKLDMLDAVDQFKYYDLRIIVNNHLGDYIQNEYYYKKAISVGDEIGSFKVIDQKRELMNRYAGTRSNIFDFQGALKITEQLIESQKAIEEILTTANYVLFEKETSVKNDIVLGKFLSAKGQYLAFLNQNEAYESFHDAIKLMGNDLFNKRKTTSYFIHFIAESDIPLNTIDLQLLNEYFAGKDFTTRLEYLLQLDDLNADSIPYQLFAFTKLYAYRLRKEVNLDGIRKLIDKLKDYPPRNLNHPWPLIYFNLGKIVAADDQKEYWKLLMRAEKIISKKENKITLELIKRMIKLEISKNGKTLKEFIDFVNKSNISSLNEYFEIDQLQQIVDINNKVNKILSKFTFMYH